MIESKQSGKDKDRKRRWMMAVLFLMVAVTGFLYARRQPQMLAEEAGTKGETLAFHANVFLRYHYALCGHDMEQEADARRYIGLTKEEMAEEFPGFTIKKFSAEQAILQRTYSCYCPEHILAYLEGEYVVLKKCEDFGDALAEMQHIPVRVEKFSREDKEALIAGKVFSDVESAQKFLGMYRKAGQEQH